jgi:heme-degrading monooxygenase HmoA
MDPSGQDAILINLFEVPAEADQEFVEGWERADRFLRTKKGYLSTELHRSLAPNADFRFANVARWSSPEAFREAINDPGFLEVRMPFPAHASLYRVVREDPPVRDEPNPPVLINAFEVPAGEDDVFLAAWERARDFLRDKEGYVATRLHQSLAPEAEFRFVNIGLWANPQVFVEAVGDPGFREASNMPYRPHPSLYEVVGT